MAPTTTSVEIASSSNRSIHYLHRRMSTFFQHAQRQPASREVYVSNAPPPPEGPELPPPLSTDPVAPFISEQLAPASTGNSQPPRTLQSDDVPGNVTAAVIVAVVLVGGLLGLVIGGDMLRRRVKQPQAAKFQQASRWWRRKSKRPNHIPSIRIEPSRVQSEGFAYDEKTLTPLDVAPVAARRDRRGRISDVWPLRALSLRGHLSAAKSASAHPGTPCTRQAPVLPPLPPTQTTWSEFSPGLLSVAHSTPKHFLARIPEELEDECESQSGSEIAMALGIALQRSLDSGSVLSTTPAVRSRSLFSMHSSCFAITEAVGTTEQKPTEDHQVTDRDDTMSEDSKSIGSPLPEMTSDNGSTRSSSSSFQSTEGECEATEEIFELRRVQTRSMQMNKAVLVSLCGRNGADTENGVVSVSPDTQSSTLLSAEDEHTTTKRDAESYSGSRLTLASLAESYSAINLDDFPSPPSILPMIPSFVSGF